MAGSRSGNLPWTEPDAETRRAWVDVAMGRRAPTRWLRGGRVLNVFTGEVLEAGVALWHDRIAYVGPLEPLIGPDTVVEDLDGHLLAPAYIEIHAHPFQLYSPWSLGRLAAARGTTTLVCDTSTFLHLLGPGITRLLDASPGGPARLLWGLRISPQTETGLDGPTAFGLTTEQMISLLDHPRVVEVFEWADWTGVIRAGEPLPEVIAAALARGLPIDAHAPGASHRTLAALAAAGASDCHESIRADEVLERLRVGLYVPLRHSSLRPDLPDLVAAVRATDGFERLMLTTDGPSPAFAARGLMDQAVAAAVANGVRFTDAVRMATLHPAAYLGLDRHLGAVAPGRLADLLVLPGEGTPVPERVYVAGTPVAERGRLLEPTPPPDWDALGLGPRPMPAPPGLDAALFTLPAEGAEVTLPTIDLLNAVITRQGEARLPVRGGRADLSAAPDLCLAVLLPALGPEPQRALGSGRAPENTGPAPALEPAPPVVRALVRGFGSVAGLATSYTCAFAPLVIGRDPRAMARALDRILEAGGGISLWDHDGERFFLPLPVGCTMTDLDVDHLARHCEDLLRLLAERGYPFHDPIYTLLFLTANHLPAVRLSRLGLWDVKRRRVVQAAGG